MAEPRRQRDMETGARPLDPGSAAAVTPGTSEMNGTAQHFVTAIVFSAERRGGFNEMLDCSFKSALSIISPELIVALSK